MTRRQLKQIIKEELLNEASNNTKDIIKKYYSLLDDWVDNFSNDIVETNMTMNDAKYESQLIKITKSIEQIQKMLKLIY